uniref:Uncharacterized protein n=1 Tax=Panagrolaimus davidi TaxID=227884 RepID=A0A914NZ99_9BILA
MTQQQQPSSYQSSYQAPPSQYQPPPLPPPLPPPPSLPAPEYQPPNIYLPGSSSPEISLPSSNESPSAQYPSQEYQQMLSPDQNENNLPQQPPRQIQTSAPEYSTTPKVEAYRESYHNSVVKVGSASGGNERSDQTAYRESYKHENGESVARFESGSIHAPPPEDPPVENESKDGDDYNQDVQQQMTLTIQKLATTEAYSSPTPSITSSPITTTTTSPPFTVPPTANVYKQAPPQEYAAVLKEPLEDRKRDQFFTYNDQVCTGIVLAQSQETSILESVKKCMEMGCAAANIRGDENDDETFKVVYLKIADSRKDNKGFYCISIENIPTFGNDFDKIESEIKLRKKVK